MDLRAFGPDTGNGMKNWLTSIAWILGGVCSFVAIGVFYNQLLAPRQVLLAKNFPETPEYDRISETITGTTLEKDLASYLDLGSRFTGSDGFYAMADFLEKRLRKLGYRIEIQEHDVVVPKTRFCHLLDEKGDPVPDIEIHPYYPNRLRTSTTPPEGITGKVVFKGDPDGEDKIAALDAAKGNIMLLRVRERFEDYANFGARAVLYFLDEENDPKAWFYRRKDSHASVDIPVFFVKGDYKSLIGKTVTLKARVDWDRARVKNIFAILDPDPAATEVADETILINAYYDSWSPIPALAPGARQALGLQGLMQTAAHFAHSANRSHFRRKIVFFLSAGRGQASAGSRQLVSALGEKAEPGKILEARAKEHEERSKELAHLREVRELVPDYFRTASTRELHNQFWHGKKEQLAMFRQELSLTLDELALKAEEDAMDAKLAWIRVGKRKGAELDLYLAKNKRAQVYRSMTAAKPYMLVQPALDPSTGGYASYFDENAYWEPGRPTRTAHGSVRHAKMYEASYKDLLDGRVKRLLARLDHRIEQTEFALRQNEQDQRIFEEIRGPDGHRRVLGIEINFSDKTKQLVLASGGWWWSPRSIPADREIELQFKYAQEKLFPDTSDADKFQSRVPSGDAWSCGQYWFIYHFHSTRMTFMGYTSFLLLTKGDDREFFACPMDTPEEINWDNVVAQERVIVGGLERLAIGRGKIVPTSMPLYGRDFAGLTTSVRGNSLVPNHPEANAVVQMTCGFWGPGSWRHYTNGGGYWTALMDPYPMTMSDDLGRYTFRNCFAHRWWKVDFHAARSTPETGDLTWIRDLGYESKYPTHDLRVYQVRESTRIVMFRCTPVHIFKAENPKSMKLYDHVEARLIRGFSRPKKYFTEQFYAGEYMLYLQPDVVFYPTYLFGSPENQSLLRIAGIGLNMGEDEFAHISADDYEIAGKGYLAADATFLIHPEDDLARSMSAINSRRAMKYSGYHLLDEPTLESVEKARMLAMEGDKLRDKGDQYDAFNVMKDSLAYSTSIHPVIKNSKAEAVYGIVFYLLLLIPFAFFMEKLVIGSSDIRWQIFWVGTLFLAVFMGLRAIHPAFEIVRSSFMILLGFITMILSLMVTFFVSTKFRAAVMEYQKIVHGQQATAEVTKASAAFTGFLLGINNMRKRKVRTALTASTLVLITFVMICFTAVENDYVEVMYPIGKAPYTGLEIRRNTLSHLGNQTTVLVQAFENDFDVAVRRWDVGGLWGLMPMNKKLEAETYISPEEVDNLPVVLNRRANGKDLRWTSRGSLDLGPSPDYEVKDFLLCGDRWFATENERSLVLSGPAAKALGITPDMVRAEKKPVVLLKGKEFEVINLFDADKLAATRDSKDKPIVPVDLPAERKRTAKEQARLQARKQALEKEGKTDAEIRDILAKEKEEKGEVEKPRLPAADIVLFPKQRQPTPEAIVSHFKGKLRVNQKEPINFDRIFLTKVPPHPDDKKHKHYWFRDDEADTCFIPDRMAAEMKITPEMVETSNVRIRVQGTVLDVKGIYDANRFDQVHDLDGESLAPYDVESIIGRPREEETSEDEMPEMMKRLSGADIIICNDHSRTSGWHVASIAIDLSKAGSHKRVRQILDRYLEKTGSKAFYGIGDTAYFGAKFRRSKGSNYLELLIPLLIASLTVLNTMRGSVYERKEEIYVYNAVGLNPFHVFFLFIAEACVYAVVGALGGYLVANAAGSLVMWAGWNAGLTINYSSIYAVMYSMVIMGAVLLSTWFPARAAARLAAPAEEMKWRVPEPQDGEIRFTLPFTFSVRDRVAIIAYFMGWFDEFGEGSSGKFFCLPPRCDLDTFDGVVSSCVRTTVWLRPYDLGVSQELIMHFREDPDSGQTTAHLTLKHLSGGASAWVRTNYLFLKILRKHFLDWRVVPENEKLHFLQRARHMLGAEESMIADAQKDIDRQIAELTAADEISEPPEIAEST